MQGTDLSYSPKIILTATVTIHFHCMAKAYLLPAIICINQIIKTTDKYVNRCSPWNNLDTRLLVETIEKTIEKKCASCHIRYESSSDASYSALFYERNGWGTNMSQGNGSFQELIGIKLQCDCLIQQGWAMCLECRSVESQRLHLTHWNTVNNTCTKHSHCSQVFLYHKILQQWHIIRLANTFIFN